MCWELSDRVTFLENLRDDPLPPSRVGQHVAIGMAAKRSAATRLKDLPLRTWSQRASAEPSLVNPQAMLMRAPCPPALFSPPSLLSSPSTLLPRLSPALQFRSPTLGGCFDGKSRCQQMGTVRKRSTGERHCLWGRIGIFG